MHTRPTLKDRQALDDAVPPSASLVADEHSAIVTLTGDRCAQEGVTGELRRAPRPEESQ